MLTHAVFTGPCTCASTRNHPHTSPSPGSSASTCSTTTHSCPCAAPASSCACTHSPSAPHPCPASPDPQHFHPVCAISTSCSPPTTRSALTTCAIDDWPAGRHRRLQLGFRQHTRQQGCVHLAWSICMLLALHAAPCRRTKDAAACSCNLHMQLESHIAAGTGSMAGGSMLFGAHQK